MSQLQENGWIDGWKDRWKDRLTLFYRTLPAIVWGPKRVAKCKKIISLRKLCVTTL